MSIFGNHAREVATSRLEGGDAPDQLVLYDVENEDALIQSTVWADLGDCV